MDTSIYESLREIRDDVFNLECAVGLSQVAEFKDDKCPFDKSIDSRLWKLENGRGNSGCALVVVIVVVAICSFPLYIGWSQSEASPAKYAEAEALVDTEHRKLVDDAMRDGKMTNGEFFWMWPETQKDDNHTARQSLTKRLYKP